MEVREDVLGRKVLFSEKRGKRPKMFEADREKEGVCVFCKGNEGMTPKSVLQDKEDWTWRIFPNKYPIPAGRHDVLVDSPTHEELIWNPEVGKRMIEGFREYEKRIGKGYRSVVYFKNKGKEAGASIPHTHCQIVASQDDLPEVKRRRSKKFREYLEWELASERSIGRIFFPYASIQPFEAWVVTPWKGFEEAEEGLGLVLHHLLNSISEFLGDFPYNIVFYQTRKVGLHAQVLPRVNKMAGFEYGSGIIVNTLKPEKAFRVISSRLKRRLRRAGLREWL